MDPEPIQVRARRFPALVNCVTIDWFQPWPEEALLSVSQRFLSDVDLGDASSRASIVSFMPYSFLAVNRQSELYALRERRYNYTTPKSFLELIALYKAMLAKGREETEASISRLESGVAKLEATASSVAELEDQLREKSLEVEEKKVVLCPPLPLAPFHSLTTCKPNP